MSLEMLDFETSSYLLGFGFFLWNKDYKNTWGYICGNFIKKKKNKKENGVAHLGWESRCLKHVRDSETLSGNVPTKVRWRK